MKKCFMISVAVILTVIVSTGCDKNPLEYLKLKSVKIAEGNESGGEKSLDDLLEEAKEYENDINSKGQASSKLGSVYEKIGIKYAETKSWELSIDSLEKALKYGNDSAKVHFYLGASYSNRGMNLGEKSDFDKAVFHYKKSLEKNSSNSEALYGLAFVEFYGLGDKESGLKKMKIVVDSDERNINARFALGRMYYESGKMPSALSVYEGIYAYAQNMPSSSKKDDYIKNAKANIDQITSSYGNSSK
ncbi:MAG: tetratricopeptide repeat protein [Spirochaetes bacterium]|nr:tetratricopeptide repeat protein [Spirochaetota bacterium]